MTTDRNSPRTHRHPPARALLVLAALLLTAMLAGPPTALAHGSARTQAAGSPASCLVHSLPSFVAQGEFAQTGTVADVVEVECNPFVYGTGAEVTITAAQLFDRCQHELTWYVPSESFEPPPVETEIAGAGAYSASGPSVDLHLDVDGNATVALLAGPHCMVGESLITLDEDEAPYETFTTAFQVLPAASTPEGVQALPSSQVEDAGTSSVVTIVEAEFGHAAEDRVRLAAGQLYSRCRLDPKTIWVQEDGEVLPGRKELAGEEAIQLDNDGNGFAILIGSESCAEGPTLIEADLEESPFTTQTGTFTVLPPQPTAEPAFSIVKDQQIKGSGSGFTTAQLTGYVGQVVEYQIVVSNTGSVAENFSGFSDPNCDPGTISGGASEVQPGGSVTYTCSHTLTTVGSYLNTAAITGNTTGGSPIEQTSNTVEVIVAPPPMPGFTIEKLQRIAGSGLAFTASPLSGLVGQTVEYEIVVTNTGNVSLTMTSFSDPHCDAGTIAGGPGSTPLATGASTTYTCSHVLAAPGVYLNVATATGKGEPPGEGTVTHTSETVEVTAITPEPSFAVEKLQRLAGSGGAFTTQQITGAVGQTVEYEIIVKNTGNVLLTLTNFSDPRCDPGTLAGGPGGMPIAPGGSVTYTCTHALTATGSVINVASVEATPPPGGGVLPPVSSHEVEAVVPPAPGPGSVPSVAPPPNGEVSAACDVSTPRLRGGSGVKSGTFTASVPSTGIKQITFYLDGRKLKTMKASQARHGLFTVTVKHGYSYGVHRLSFKAVMFNVNCAQVASSHAFVRPRAAAAPEFTG